MVANIIFIIIISFIIIAICITAIGRFNMNLKKWTLLMIAVFYGGIFGLVFLLTYKGYNTILNTEYINEYGLYEILIYFISVIIMIVGIELGFKIKTKNKGIININNPVFLDNSGFFWNKLFIFSVFFLFLSIVAYYLYAMAYGGFDGLLNYTISIRSSTSDISNRWSFLQKAGSFAYISGYALFCITINKECTHKRRIESFIFWSIALFFSLYVAYSQGGRGTLANIVLIYILTLVFNYSNNFFQIIRKHWKKFISVPVAFFIMNTVWRRSSTNNILELVTSGYSYFFSSFILNLKNTEFRWFIDIVQIPLYFLPSSIYSQYGIKTANQFNTFLMHGGYKGDFVNGRIITGEATTGILSVSYMQASFLGVFIFALLVGICFSKWQKRLLLMEKSTFKSMIYAYYVVGFVYGGVVSGDPAAFITSNFAYFVFFFIFRIYYKLRI